MRVVGYRKTDQGMVLVGSREIDLDRKPTTVIERYNAFFQDVPLHGGHEWKTLSIDEIVTIFRDAAVEIHQACQAQHDASVLAHASRNFIVRGWQDLWGWKAPEVPSLDAIVDSMVVRCRALSTWMRGSARRPFYAGSDMSHFITKPWEVSNRLATT